MLASARVAKFGWRAGEMFEAQLWILAVITDLASAARFLHQSRPTLIPLR